MATADAEVLAAVGPRLRALRTAQGLTLAQVSERTGISASTLSRLESGGRRPTLELLLPLTRTYQAPLDDLVTAQQPPDPRVRSQPITRHGETFLPLSRRPGGIQAFKAVYTPPTGDDEPQRQSHEGY